MKALAGRVGWPVLGFAAALVLWALGARGVSDVDSIREAFSPDAGLRAFARLWAGGDLWPHARVTLWRIAQALVIAVGLGVPIGILIGLSRRAALATGTLFQFLRMISPLSLMPLAVMVLGVGDAPVVFLLSFAAVWPVVINTAAGVAALDPHWLRLAESLSATRWEVVTRIVLPGIVAHVLTGFRLAVGIAWIVLVPAEMLGVSAGLGYFILDTRDRLAYDELTAGILTVGCLGFLLDSAARAVHARWISR